MIFFSVVIPLYNKEKYIKNTLCSVLNQTHKYFEIIIVNDGSTDDSLNVVSTISDNRIKIINQHNKGLSAARNKGIKAAKYNYIAFLDADDLWFEDFLEVIHNLIKTYPKQNIFATNVDLLCPKKTPILSSSIFKLNNIKVITNFFNINRNIISPSSLVVEKSVFEKVGFFDNTINYGEEYDFYIRCFSHYDLIYYEEPKIFYMTNVPNQLTSPNKMRIRRIPNYDKYLITHDSKYLDKFLDFVHFELVVLFKMEKNYKQVEFYKKKITTSNLPLIKKVKYYLPTQLFYYSKRIYLWFLKVFSHS